MARFNLVRNSFLGGEISPKSFGRTDLPQWNHSHERLENFLSLVTGGGIRRPGFRKIRQTQDNKTAACYPFAFNDSESYVLEISTPASGNSVIKIVDATNFSVYDVSSGTSLIPLYDEADLDRLHVKQAADVLWIAHGDYQPIILYRTSGPAFGVELVQEAAVSSAAFGYTKYHQFMPFRPSNVADITLKPNATTGTTYITAATSAAALVYMFDPLHIGAYFKITQTSAGNRYTGMAKITGMKGSASGGKYAQADVTVMDAFVNTTADDDWEESSWSDYRGWPRTVDVMESRVWFGGNTSEPDRGWASATSAFFNLDARGSADGGAFPSQTATSPFSFTPNSGEINQIQFLSAGKTMFIGTSQREFILQGPDATASISTSNILMSPETAHGSRYAMAQRVAYSVIAIQPTGRKLREYVFDFVSNSYEGTDISLHASHLLQNKIARIAWQEEPHGILWARDDDGGLYSLTRERQQGVLAWNRHSIGGTGAVVKSICVVPDEDGVKRLFAVIKRTINSSSYYTLECMVDPYAGEDVTCQIANHMDGHVRSTAVSATASWGTFSHLIGETVKVVAAEEVGGEPNYEGEFVVDGSGNITLNRSVKEIMVGLPYNTKIKTLRSEGGSQIGSAQGEMKRTDKLLIRFFDTFGCSYGSSDSNQKDIIFWKNNRPGRIPLFTGDKFLEFPNGWDRDGQVQIESDSPFPLGINFICARMVVNEV